MRSSPAGAGIQILSPPTAACSLDSTCERRFFSTRPAARQSVERSLAVPNFDAYASKFGTAREPGSQGRGRRRGRPRPMLEGVLAVRAPAGAAENPCPVDGPDNYTLVMTDLALREFHRGLGARFCDVGGAAAVDDYGDPLAEHAALRDAV